MERESGMRKHAMRGAICALLIVGLVLPSVSACAAGAVVGSGRGDALGRERVVAYNDSGSGGTSNGGDTCGVVMSKDDGFWIEIVRIVFRAIRDGVIYEVVKFVVKKTLERPPAPVTSPNWSETGCGMGAAGCSRY
jgi:hypothetical protein